MEPLIVLIVAFATGLLITRIVKKVWLVSFTGTMAMSIMLLFTAMGHFLYPAGMALMLPDFIPRRLEIIYLTGGIEILAATGLLIPRYRKLAAILLIIFFVLVLPANIYAAIHHVNLKTATYDGSGVNYLWFRVPLQLLFITWAYYFSVRTSKKIK